MRSCIRSWKLQWPRSPLCCFLSTVGSLKAWSSLCKADPEAIACDLVFVLEMDSREQEWGEWMREEGIPTKGVGLSWLGLCETGALLDCTAAFGGSYAEYSSGLSGHGQREVWCPPGPNPWVLTSCTCRLSICWTGSFGKETHCAAEARCWSPQQGWGKRWAERMWGRDKLYPNMGSVRSFLQNGRKSQQMQNLCCFFIRSVYDL